MRRLVCAYFFGRGLGILLAGVLAMSAGLLTTEPAPILHNKSASQLDLVADFGADPTGGTDISSALNAAIATGKPIFIPAGTFLLSGSVTDPGDKPIAIECAGSTATTIDVSEFVILKNPSSIVDCGFAIRNDAELSLQRGFK